MKLALLHLSDIHFENSQDWIVEKADLIAQSFLSNIFGEKVEALFVVISGDIANKGKADQYKVASSFLEKLNAKISSEKDFPIHFVIIPGNHDCNLGNPADLELRQLSINSILQDSSAVTKGGQIYNECLKVQNEFFDFTKQLEPTLAYPETPEVFYRLVAEVQGKKVVFNCFNTAWLTQLHEKQGALTMPRHLFPECENAEDDSSLTVSIYHHPEGWLSADNSNDFRRLLRQCSDIVISGHEHDQDVFTQKNLETGIELQVHRAGALQERGREHTSTFNVLLINLEKGEQKLSTFRWKDKAYTVKGEPEWIEYRRNEKLNGRFQLRSDFEKTLRSFDTLPILHARRANLQIDDLFVMPRLQVYSLENIIEGKPGTTAIEAGKFFDFVKERKKVLLYGETLQGKTITARFLYLRLIEQGVVPVLVDGENLRGSSFKQNFSDAFREQYQNATPEEFKQYGKANRALIIDNFGQSGQTQVDLQQFLSTISDEFNYVIAIAHTNLRLQQFIKNENEEVRFSEFSHCEVKPFNRHQRSNLIEKWVMLANASQDDDEITRQIKQLEQAVETACESGIIAPFPAYILGILTLSQNTNLAPDQTRYGTVGYLYESLITSRFSGLDLRELDLEQNFILLGGMAFHIFSNDLEEISIEETQQIVSKYESDYLQNVYAEKFINQVVEAGIILRNNGRLQFNSLQLRDFFVADYYNRAFGDKARSDEAYKQIDHIIKTVTYESHTRILLFLVFKANDKPRFIEQILNTSRQIFSGYELTDFDTDVEFLNELKEASVPKPKVIQECSSVFERRKLIREDNDESEDENESLFVNRDEFLVEYREDLSEFIKAAITLKMIEVLGQLARSFASTLKGDVKISIIEETIALGLRFLKSRFIFRTEDIEELRHIVAELIKHKHSELNEQELLERADQLLLFSYFGVTFGVIKKISLSIGHEDLKGSFDKFFATQGSSLSYRIVEAAFRLDHYPDPLIHRIIKLGEELEESNKFIWDVLRNLVAEYINLSSVSSAADRQKLISKFKLAQDSQYLANSESAERKYLPKARHKFSLPEKVTSKKRK